MKLIMKIATATFAACAFMACKKSASTETGIEGESTSVLRATQEWNSYHGAVYAASNQTEGNSILFYTRATNGALKPAAKYATGGVGTGGGLGNQGGVVLSTTKKELFVVNAGSNTISSFKVLTSGGLERTSVVSSGGPRPVSITQYANLVFVLNAGDSGNIAGFKLTYDKKLIPIPNSKRSLSAAVTGAAQVSFSNKGSVLVITEKATNKIITYTVNANGIPAKTMHSITAANPTPFGFATGLYGNIFVSEAAGGAANAGSVSSYKVANDGSITLTKGPVRTMQTAACWVVLADNYTDIYTTNTASNTISSYKSNATSGALALNKSIAATTGMGPIDAAFANDSRYLYTLNGANKSISVLAVSGNGSLTTLPTTIVDLPTGTNGLAAW